MRLKKIFIPLSALAVVLSANVLSAAAADHDRHDNHRGRGDRHPSARDGRSRGDVARAPRLDHRRAEVRAPRHDDRQRWSNRGNGYDRVPPRIVGPRVIAPRYGWPRRLPNRFYGPGPGLSVYFGLGSGYRYGAPYSGRVYGYVGPRAYGVRRYYGDVRLQVRPREAAVYVDGYYAGIVDDFDGVFQRLTLEAGVHQIELQLPGFAPHTYRVHVDPSRTVDVHGDLYPGRS